MKVLSKIAFTAIIALALGSILQAQDSFRVNDDGTLGSISVTGDVLVSGAVQAVGNVKTSGNLQANGTVQASAGFGYVPVGTILPWYNVSATASLPDGWFKCDGQTVVVTVNKMGAEGDLLDGNADSKFITPPLNKNSAFGNRGMFLRGSTVAGTVANDTVQNHVHSLIQIGSSFSPSQSYPSPPPGAFSSSLPYANTIQYALSTVSNNNVGGMTSGNPGSETAPLNMTVIWIIRLY